MNNKILEDYKDNLIKAIRSDDIKFVRNYIKNGGDLNIKVGNNNILTNFRFCFFIKFIHFFSYHFI